MADNNDISLSESQLSSDSGVQTNESNLESQLTESKIMEGVTSQSTPTLIKRESNSDMMSIMSVSYTHLDVYKRQTRT